MSTFLLCLVAAVSPVIFLNGSGIVARSGIRGGLQFVAGNLLVLFALGLASMGLLGSAAATVAEREIASRTVDRFLGAALLAYGIFLLVEHIRHRDKPPATTPRDQGEFPFGMLSMATNFTTLPIFLSIGQRIGATHHGLFLKWVLVLGAAIIVAAPAWIPVAVARFGRHRGGLSAATHKRITDATQLISIGACLVGAVFLLVRGF